MLLFLIILRAFYPTDHTTVETSMSSNYTVQAYNTSDKGVELECVDDGEFNAEEFATMKKMWKKDGQESFNTSNIIFVDSNSSIRFTSLVEEDGGMYSCCVRSTEEKPYKCFDRSLSVVAYTDDVAALLLRNGNFTEDDTNETVWSVVLAQDHLLRAREGDTYFVKLFKETTTDICCDLNGSFVQLETAKDFPQKYGDVLIRNFNATIHSGNYECNATYSVEHVTKQLQTKFTALGSSQPNINQTLLDINTVAEYLTRAASTRTIVHVIFAVFLYLI
ncbi:hypothetical protein ANCCAN_05818 [Ancylostoma caninum]|uniref:Ig-like domain-containing protein n=1 Tax=Ancylostoma caninum TaxID=29170 RepID=A0A368GUT6_ANCCA|nr:hypothetical protein ANCCAN_05818 [Ancylostoma caninum]